MNGDDDIVACEAKSLGNFRIEEFRDSLNLEIVIARTERPHFSALAFLGALGHAPGLGARHPALFLDPLEVARLAPAALDRPMRSACEHCLRTSEDPRGGK